MNVDVLTSSNNEIIDLTLSTSHSLLLAIFKKTNSITIIVMFVKYKRECLNRG